MKCLIVFSALLVVAYGQFVGFQQPKRPSYPFPPVAPPPRPQVNVPRGVSSDRDAVILKSGDDIQPDGSYNYFYETNNGIAAQAEGTPKQFPGNPPLVPVVARGSFSWTAPDGQVVAITYVADENGYQPVGDAIPTPPPIPEAILRSIEFNARNARP